MKLHPVTIMIGLLVFEHFFGILGMILATPYPMESQMKTIVATRRVPFTLFLTSPPILLRRTLASNCFLFGNIFKKCLLIDSTFVLSLLKVLAPLFIGFVIAWLFNPLVKKLESKGISRTMGAILVYTINKRKSGIKFTSIYHF